MSAKEVLLNIKSQDEISLKKDELEGLDYNGPEVQAHYRKIVVDDAKKKIVD